jgi:hypothetical protein
MLFDLQNVLKKKKRRRSIVVEKSSERLVYSIWFSFEAVIIEKTIEEK